MLDLSLSMARKTIFFLFIVLLASRVHAQCNYTLSMFEMLGEAQTASASADLGGNLTSVQFNLNFTGTGVSYPADMMVYIYAPNGEWFGEDGTSTQLALALTSELEPPIHGLATGAPQ